MRERCRGRPPTEGPACLFTRLGGRGPLSSGALMYAHSGGPACRRLASRRSLLNIYTYTRRGGRPCGPGDFLRADMAAHCLTSRADSDRLDLCNAPVALAAAFSFSGISADSADLPADAVSRIAGIIS